MVNVSTRSLLGANSLIYRQTARGGTLSNVIMPAAMLATILL
jgi:hypothetical protein